MSCGTGAVRSATSTRISPRLRASGMVERYWSNATRVPSAEIVGWLAQSAIAMIGAPAGLVRGGPLLRRCPSHRGSWASWRRSGGPAAHGHGAAPVHPADLQRAVLLDAQVAEARGRHAEDRLRVALDRALVQRVEVDVLREVPLDDDPVGAGAQRPEPGLRHAAAARRHDPVGELR